MADCFAAGQCFREFVTSFPARAAGVVPRKLTQPVAATESAWRLPQLWLVLGAPDAAP